MKPIESKLLLVSALLATVLVAGTGCQSARHKSAETQTQAAQAAITPADALARLKAGNGRFVTGHSTSRDFTAQRQATATGQYPFAVVLSCIDSRTSTEVIFDQGIGDVFNARVAGNVLNDDILGSMEFACKAAGAKLIAVIGHSKCGAVKGACGGVELGHLTGLLGKIQPAVAAVPVATNVDKASPRRVDAVAKENVRLALKQIRERSPILAELICDGKVGLVGGLHDLDSGRVTFFD
jgi:carbonic anhydrase